MVCRGLMLALHRASLIELPPVRRVMPNHNLKDDYAVLRRYELEPDSPHFDTMLAAYACFGDWEFWNLAAIVKKLLGLSIKRYRDIVGAGETFLDRPFNELVDLPTKSSP